MTEKPDYEQLALDHLQDSPRTALVYALLNLAAVDRRAAEQQQEEQLPIDGGPARYATERLSVVGRTTTGPSGRQEWAGMKVIDRDTGEARVLGTIEEIDATYRMLRQAARLGGETSVRLLCEENNPDGGHIDVAHDELSRLMTAMRGVTGVRLAAMRGVAGVRLGE